MPLHGTHVETCYDVASILEMEKSLDIRFMRYGMNTIEGLHDAVRTHTRMILPHRLVSFLYGAV